MFLAHLYQQAEICDQLDLTISNDNHIQILDQIPSEVNLQEDIQVSGY
jgi:hypothetical protein